MPMWSQWGFGAVVSVSVHVALAVLVVSQLTTPQVQQAQSPETRLNMATLDVPQQSVRESDADTNPAAEQMAELSEIGQGEVSFSRAALATPIGDKSGLEIPQGQAVGAFAPDTQAIEGKKELGDALVNLTLVSVQMPDVAPNTSVPQDTKLTGARIASIAASATVAQSTAVGTSKSRPLVPDSVALPNQRRTKRPMAILEPASQQTPPVIAKVPRLTTTTPRSNPLPESIARKQFVAAARVPAQDAQEQQPAIRTTKVAGPASVKAPVLLAWTGNLSTALEQQTLDTAAALRVANPGEGGQEIRDSLANKLTAVSCARAQTGYDPDTGTIELRGHVKSDADRETLMAAVQNGLQGALPIQDRLRRLPAPQCDVLTALADMPLPQSVEQFVNPLIIGDDLHARIYEFTEGDRIRFELQGADYSGWLYLDYYDGKGRVLHLLPNAQIPPLLLDAEQHLTFGGGGTTDIASGKLELRVSPPFGEDIVVAMVTSDPLFDDLRPTVEDAASYLAIVENRVAAMTDNASDFRGEWVYLFVETSSERR